MHLLGYLAIFTAGIAGLLEPVSATALDSLDLGHWDVNITSARSAQGFEAQFTWAIYSGRPNRTIYDEWSYNPQTQNMSTQRNTRDFSIDLHGICGVGSAATIKQRVDINGQDYWVVGKTNVDFKINTVTGRGGTASFRVNATLDQEAVDVCGRPLNHEPSV